MPLFEFEGRRPQVSPAAWIAPTAILVGDVRVEAEASVWYGAVLRADFGPILVRRGANVQDGSVLHGGTDPVTEVREGATIGHLCVIHGAVIGYEALVGNGATVLDGVVVGRRALVAAGCTVPPGMTIPDDMLAVGVPARIAGEVTGGAKQWVQTNPALYRELARRHAVSVRPVDRKLPSGLPSPGTRDTGRMAGGWCHGQGPGRTGRRHLLTACRSMTATDELGPAEQAALRGQCTVFLAGHGPVSAAGLLASIPADTAVDRYGVGGVVAELETEIAGLLGKPAAAFLPSGTMAQQSVLRVHADRRQRRTVVFHPMCHLHRHEGQGFQRLHGLTGRPAGDPDRLLSIDDLTAIAEPPAALLIELPQRDLGGQQPDWADLRAQADWARGRGAAVHLDGARIWESAAGYGRPLREIAALFDTVYVSFYKGLGALPGCCVAGPADILAEVREWRHRMGGTLFGLWPNAASALSRLRCRLPLMPEYLSHARDIAAALSGVAGVRVVPDPPQVPMMHLLLNTTPDRFAAAARRLAVERRIWTWPTAMSTGDPAVQRVELSVGDATRALAPAQVSDIIAALLA